MKYSMHGLLGYRGGDIERDATLLDVEEAEELQRARPELGLEDAVAVASVTRLQRMLRPNLFFTVRVFETEQGKELHIKLEPPPAPANEPATAEPQPAPVVRAMAPSVTPAGALPASDRMPGWPLPWDKKPSSVKVVFRDDQNRIMSVEEYTP